MKYTILSLLLFVQVSHLMGQNNNTFVIQGKVTDSFGEPAIYAHVIIDALKTGAYTDEEGNYLLKKVPQGTHQLSVKMLGYKTQERSVQVENTSLFSINFTIIEDLTNLEEIVVNTKTVKSKLESTAKAIGVIETKKIRLQSADLGEVMAKSEGVSVQRSGGLGSNTRFALNGLSGEKVRFFYDGIPLEFTLYSFGIANVPVNAIHRIEVYKGVVPIGFGADALGGAVNMVPQKVHNGWFGGMSYQLGSFNTHRTTADIGYSSDKTGFFVKAGGFYDHTDNNYKIDVAIPNDKGGLQQETVRRFHDAYSAYGSSLRFGVRNKKWANELSLESYYGDYNNEVQNSQSPQLIDQPDLGISNAVAGIPFGEVLFTNYSLGTNLTYDVNLHDHWTLNLKAGYNYNERKSLDIGNQLYNWFGEVIRAQNIPGEFGDADNLITKSENLYARQQTTYIINDRYSLKLSLAPTYTYRTGDDLLIDGPFDEALDDSYLFNFVTGLEYTANLMEEKLQNIAFVKNYRQNIRNESLDPSLEVININKRSVSNYGVGNGLRYNWSSHFSTKISYEYAYRLPQQNEIFGDGYQVFENLELQPESSHNVNLQWNYHNNYNAVTQWQLQGNLFLRKIDNLIFLVVDPAEGFGSYQNVSSANSQGLELSGKIKDVVKGLSFNANTTYQSYLNTSSEGPFASFKNDRIPNTPYFFANGGAEYQLQNVLKKNDQFSLFWNVRYVHSFFIGWESAGSSQYKSEVPKQTLNTTGITHKVDIKNTRNALTFEVQNLMNAKIFDLYGLQRPGRTFHLKFTTQF
ncbi:carboxypeptidase-like regulatory domain-containing protein [Flavivirga aquimarina]|uniref:Carboxypeptidase-like regulatory domain-containing protein n=1 Tax=Flavivirga aquimarina TaxID=2027862 RepID=A0ABT8W5B3_9FLAO|nr:TonB-dependent receptor [Flavivirga aquimarina]MDO5968262.1 carboxypeptidase-like regulatory domain-containing protein [Flavivirga aquimarina]